MKNVLTKVELLRTALAIGISLLVTILIIFLVSGDPVNSIGSFILGPLSTFRRFGNVVELMIPLMFSGLATMLLFRTGLFNLIGEASIFAGAVVATIIAISLDLPPFILLFLAFLGAALAGGIIGFIPGVLKVRTNANVIVTSLMLNYVILNIGLYLIQDRFRDPAIPSMYSYRFPPGMRLPVILQGTRIHAGLIIIALLIVMAHFLFSRTAFGYRTKLVGSNQHMAEYAGISAGRMILGTSLLGGMVAGLGGAVELFGMFNRFQYTSLTGYGWDGILIAIVARHDPKLVPLSALFLSYIRTGADIMARETDVPFEIVQIIQAILIVFVSAQVLLAGYRKNVLKKEADRLEQVREAMPHE